MYIKKCMLVHINGWQKDQKKKKYRVRPSNGVPYAQI